MTDTNPKKAFDLIYESGKSIETDQFQFACRGNFNSSITDNILFLTEGNLLSLDSPKIAKKVYYLMVEGLQNITRHQDKTQEGGSYEGGLFIINRHKEAYSITNGNWVASEIKEMLEDRLGTISNKEQAELKEYYFEILNNSGFSSKGGAGLGLVDMARKSSGKLSYQFVPINDGYFYYLNLCIAIDKETFDETLTESYLNQAIVVHNEMIDCNAQIIFKGLLNEDNVNHLSNQIDTAVSDDPDGDGLGIVMTELLRNVAKHAYNHSNDIGKPGVFLLQRVAGGYAMLSGNFILESARDHLDKIMHEINVLTAEDLNDYINKNAEGDHTRGTGLMQLRKISGHSIDHEIFVHFTTPPFFILKIQLTK